MKLAKIAAISAFFGVISVGARIDAQTTDAKAYVEEKRHALVIGNGAYDDAPLANPTNDAEDMAEALAALGFEVSQLKNASLREMKEAIRLFGEKLEQGGVGLFYYAGHGSQVDGVNYLIPVRARIEKESDIEFEGVDTRFILKEMNARGGRPKILILDACRDNPFEKAWDRSSSMKGLAQMIAPKGFMIVYATAPGSVAKDGEERNGVFTAFLLKHIATVDTTVESMLKMVRNDVVAETNGFQIPWNESSLIEEFYFNLKEKPRMYLPKVPEPQQGETAPSSVRFAPFGKDSVIDKETGLVWANRDNGWDIDWSSAKSYCESFEGDGYKDWRLPTVDELKGLFNEGFSGYLPECFGSKKIFVTDRIRLSCCCLWASEARGPAVANFNFHDGKTYYHQKRFRDLLRVLPVRQAD